MVIDISALAALQADLAAEGIDSLAVEQNDYPYEIKPTVVQDIFARLLCQEMKSVLLVGPPGSGKTSLVRFLANEIGRSRHPVISRFRIVSLNVASVLAGSEYRGSFEKKVTFILNRCEPYSNLVLFFDEAHSMKFTRSREGVGIMDILKPRMTTGSLRLILATTDDEVGHLDDDVAFMRRLHVIRLGTIEGTTAAAIGNLHLERLLRKHREALPQANGLTTEDFAALLNHGLPLHELIDTIDLEISRRALHEFDGQNGEVSG
ncbi:AAA family ATPase [Rhizobium ruizarguesonis]